MHVNSAASAVDLWKLLQTAQTGASPSAGTGFSSATGTSSDGATLSGPGKLFSSLDSLSQANPEEFKKITSQIATQLQAAAKDANDPSRANALHQLASNFQSASKSGNFSDLFSQILSDGNANSSVGQSSHAGAPHHHYHADSDSDSSATATTTGGTSDSLGTIFGKALSQIQIDLQSSTASTPKF